MLRQSQKQIRWIAASVSAGVILSVNATSLAQQPTVKVVPVAIQFQSQTSVAPEAESTPVSTESSSSTQRQNQAENLSPITLPPLTVPNLKIASVGTGQMPDDFVAGRLPPSRVLPYGPDRPYSLPYTYKTWTAPAFCHQPLYYEDTMLERHGHERFPRVSPLVSGARFVATTVTLPYLAYMQPPLRDIPNTGHFRAGTPAPKLRERAPYDAGALRFQLLTTGAAFAAVP